MLVLLGHLLKLVQPRNGVLKAGAGGLEELSEKVKIAVSGGRELQGGWVERAAAYEGWIDAEWRALLIWAAPASHSRALAMQVEQEVLSTCC